MLQNAMGSIRGGCIASLLLALACETAPSTPMPPRGGDVCENLAYVFYLIGRNRDEGQTLEEQLRKAREGIGSPFERRSPESIRSFERAIDFVYREQDADPTTIRTRALDSCHIDSRGRAVLMLPAEESNSWKRPSN